MASLLLIEYIMQIEIPNFHPNPALPADVNERLAKGAAIPIANAAAISRRQKSYTAGLTEMVNSTINSNLPATVKMTALWIAADKLMEATKGVIPCKKGCTHCCHLGVAVSDVEAELIGARIGRKPAKAKMLTDFTHFDYGYHNPCTFLKDGACSIYDARPLACRLHYTLDKDDLLCQLHPGLSIPMPTPENKPMYAAEAHLLMQHGTGMMSDLREWFPGGLAASQGQKPQG